MGFDFEKKTAVLADDGVHPFSATALHTVCRAVVAILSNFDKVKNKTIHISNGVTTQEELLATTEKTLDEKWTRISYPLVENQARVVQSIAEHGYTTVDQFVGTLRTAFFGGKMIWEQTDNALLGLDGGAEKVDILEEMARIAKLRPKANRESDSRTHSV